MLGQRHALEQNVSWSSMLLLPTGILSPLDVENRYDTYSNNYRNGISYLLGTGAPKGQFYVDLSTRPQSRMQRDDWSPIFWLCILRGACFSVHFSSHRHTTNLPIYKYLHLTVMTTTTMLNASRRKKHGGVILL